MLKAAAAARDQNGIPAVALHRPLVDQADGAGDLSRGPLPLHSACGENDVEGRMPTLDNMQHIPNGGASRGSDDRQMLDQVRDGAFAGWLKQTFLRQLLLEFFERH